MKRYLLILLAGAIMIGGDYLINYYDQLSVFFTGEVISLFGWSVFIFLLDNK